MNYKLKTKEDGSKVWTKVTFNEKDDKFEYQEIVGPITLNPEEYFDRDEISINSNPPPDPENWMSYDELIKLLEEEKERTPKDFKPCVYYCTHSPGQAIEVILESDAAYSKWINNNLSIYYNLEDNRIVGFRVEGLFYLKAKHQS